ncbi:MBG domain-containing protein, partial [Flavobacterium sp. LS2R12]|uniref:MBG domain-containing protein n=1 Tax=unclassified Flavobacterium TaxID=196869 RepID=UPI003AAAF036
MNKITLKTSKIIFFILFLLVSLKSFSQTPKFTTPTLISGTDKTVGAKYRYPTVTNVDGTDVDAIVTIVNITNATIVDIDNPNNGGGSLRDRFQPVISTSQPNGNVEFQFAFYKGGTFNTAQQLKIDLSSFILEVLDLDGNEFFDVTRPNNENYTLEANSLITVSTVTPYTRFQGPSNSVDPISITNTKYIAAVNFGTLNSISFRLGNSNSSNQRQSSISFGEVSFTIPKAPIANDDSSLCKSYGTITIDVTSNDIDSNQNIDKSSVDLNPTLSGIQTSLTVSGQGTWSVNSNGIVTFVPLASFKNNPTPINYTIKDLTGLLSNEAKITITFAPNQPTSNGNITECEATPIQTLNANNALISTTGITWYDAATNGNIVTNPTLNSVGSVTYYAEYSNGTCSSLTRTAVKLTITPAIAFTATPTQPKCFGEKGSIVLSSPTGGTGTITFNSTAKTDLAAGNYTYTATDANGCSKSITVTINAAPAEIAFTATPTQPKCFGEKGSVVLSTPTGGTGTITFNSTAKTDLAAGNYTYTATDANGCSKSITVTINAAPAEIAFTATPTQPKCFGEKGSVVLSTPTGGTGTITFNSTAKTDLAAGNYTYTATDANGCSKSITVTINAAPAEIAFIATPTQPKCFGEKGSVVLSTPTGGTGTITFNSTAKTDLTAGNYTYTATDANGCSKSITVTINAAPAEIAFTATPTQPKCFGEKGSVVLSTSTGGTGTITFNSTAKTDLAAGNYTYTATDDNGCSKSITVTINAAPAEIAFIATPTQPKCFGEKGSVVLSTPTGGTGTITFNSTAKTDLAAGNYTYTATDANGCSKSITVTINAAPTKVVLTATASQITYFGGTGSVSLSADGGKGPYTYDVTNPSTTGLTAGTYTYKVTDANGCEATTSVTIVPAPEIDAVNDLLVSSNGTSGNFNAGNVLLSNPNSANTPDTVNGLAAVINQVNLTIITAAVPSTVGASVPILDLTTGQISIPAGTPAGSYSIIYKICDKQYPDNCDSATVTIPVNAPAIVAVDDAGTPVNGFTGGTAFTNVLTNDTLNGVAVVASKVSTTFVSATNTGITLSGTNVIVAAGTPAGSYSLVYRICEILNPANCDNAIVTVTVTAPVIDAINDVGTVVYGATAETAFTNVLSNDKLNGVAVVPAQVNTTFVSATNSGITLSGTNVIVAAGTPAGSYSLVYRICEILNPTNCDNATVTVTVTPKVLNVTVVAADQTKIYGDLNPELTAVVTGAVNGDTINYTLATTATQFSNVGDYPIAVTLGDNPNYTVVATDA